MLFSFFKSINDSIHQYLKNAVRIRSFSINYSNTTQSYLNAIYVNTKYVNAFKSRSQTSLKKHNPTYGMSFIVFLLQLIWPMSSSIEKK